MLHFEDAEFAARRTAVAAAMREAGLDALLIFAPESQFWLTGYDTFGYCFFQCLIFDGERTVLLTRSADLRQAQLTSNIGEIRIWVDGGTTDPAQDLARLVAELGLGHGRLGIETDTHGLTARNGKRVEAAFAGIADLVEASALISDLRLVKSEAELAYVRRAAALSDAALTAGLAAIHPGAGEADILAAMQGAVFQGGGTYPGNPFIIGAGAHALLCRSQAGRQTVQAQDQVTLEWAGTYRHYHAAAMRTVIVGTPSAHHRDLHAAAKAALLACEATLAPGRRMAEVFAAHADTLDAAGLSRHRLNACGYALGTRFAPSWMEHQMFHAGATTLMAPGMVFFLHMILMDSDSGAAMSLGRTSLIKSDGFEVLNHHDLELISL